MTPAEEEELREALNALSGVAGLTVERGWSDELAIARLRPVRAGGAAGAGRHAHRDRPGAHRRPAGLRDAGRGRCGAPDPPAAWRWGRPRWSAAGARCSGVLAGLAPGIAVAYPLTSTDYGNGAQPLVDVPWLLLGGVAVLVPLLAVAVTGLAVRSRLPMVGASAT